MRFLHILRRNRGRVFNVYWTFFLVIFWGWVCLLAAGMIRSTGFPWFYSLITEFIPAVIVAFVMDPLLIVAFIIGALFFWSFPWQAVFGSQTPPVREPDNFRRGRRILGPEAADYKAYQELMRQRNQRERKRQHRKKLS